ncbi:glycosyltransferase, partial [Erwinia amylovora]|uniref:glycosyltransferase n=1 Tax=Erwinia amylovora TaxID=552 RepID=UPI0021E12C49
LDSWRTLLPDWEHFEINEDTIGSLWMNTSYMKSVLERGEFVKATELARLVGLWSLGGIYADADVELIKDPTPLLDAPFFIGRKD